jgi:hypothetical protein
VAGEFTSIIVGTPYTVSSQLPHKTHGIPAVVKTDDIASILVPLSVRFSSEDSEGKFLVFEILRHELRERKA